MRTITLLSIDCKLLTHLRPNLTKLETGNCIAVGEAIVITSGKGGVGKTTTSGEHWDSPSVIWKESVLN